MQSEKEGDSRKQFLTFRTNSGTDTNALALTPMEAITLVLIARQARYAGNLETHGFTAAAIESATKQLGGEGMAIADWLGDAVKTFPNRPESHGTKIKRYHYVTREGAFKSMNTANPLWIKGSGNGGSGRI